MKKVWIKGLAAVLVLTAVAVFAFTGSVAAAEPAEAPGVSILSSYNIGVGYGIPYGGGFGLNIEREIALSDVLTVGPTVGLGYTTGDKDDFGWDVGLQLHYLLNQLVTPTISAMYGTNNDNKDDFSIGAGARITLGNIIQVLGSRNNYLDVSAQYENEDNDVTAAVGYVIQF